ncbi:MAG TPA: Lpg1974 family pore-forming outer membrane protein [Chlamydiales bacterium]|nr:Lpg1974 family pore-forming outer membrane protein [Chlamydiales bacterium]
MRLHLAVLCTFALTNLAADCCPPPSPQPCCPLMQKCSPENYKCSGTTFEVYGQWLFLQPNGSNIYYAAEAFPFDNAIATPPVSPNWQIFEIDPSYHSGFEVGTRFIFPNHDLYLKLDWEWLHTLDKESMDVAPESLGTGNMVGPIFDIGPSAAAYTQAKGKAVFQFDEVNCTFGKSLCFVGGLTLRVFTGAGFLRIKQSVTSTFSNSTASTSRTISAPSTFIGAGPEFGADFDYRLCGRLYFTGSSSAALYMGQLKNHTTFKSTSPFLPSLFGVSNPNVQHTSVPDRTQLIPGFEEKLGFSYITSLCSSKWTFAFGYQFQIYLNAIQSMDMTAPQVIPSLSPAITPDVGVYAVGFERTLSNFILTGPYVSLNVDF